MRIASINFLQVLLCTSVTAQDTLAGNDRTELRVDENFSLSFPTPHRVIDSLEARFFIAETPTAIYQLVYFPDSDPGFINSTERMDHLYGEAVQGTLNALPSGKLDSQQPRTIGNARAVQATATFAMMGEHWIDQMLYLTVKRKSYYLTVLYPAGMQPDVEGLFNSIKLDPKIDVRAQMTTDIISLASPEEWGGMIGKFLSMVALALGTIFLVRHTTRRRV